MKTLDEVIEAMQRAWGIEWAQMHDRVGAMRAALRAAEKEGWKLTPRYATEEMCAAARDDDLDEHYYRDVWEDMHDASPSISKDTGGNE